MFVDDPLRPFAASQDYRAPVLAVDWSHVLLGAAHAAVANAFGPGIQQMFIGI